MKEFYYPIVEQMHFVSIVTVASPHLSQFLFAYQPIAVLVEQFESVLQHLLFLFFTPAVLLHQFIKFHELQLPIRIY